MTLRERILYHQIHPLKLGTDILAAVVSLPLLCRAADSDIGAARFVR